MPLPDAKAKLQTISGVGPKVADCALLYGLHRTECFPMDVWMKRAVSLLPDGLPASLRAQDILYGIRDGRTGKSPVDK